MMKLPGTQQIVCFRWALTGVVLLAALAGGGAVAAQPAEQELHRQFEQAVQPLLATYCHTCHAKEQPKGKLDLTIYSTAAKAATAHSTWTTVLERLEAKEMPPEEAKKQPTAEERRAMVNWI